MLIMHTADRVIATLRAHEEELRQAGLRSLSLLGSVARGETEMDSEIDLCSLVVRLAAENVASTSVSFAPVAARNTPRKRCSSAHQARSPDLSKTASASFIASIASEVRSARMF